MFEPVPDYFQLEFDTPVDAQAAARALLTDVTASPPPDLPDMGANRVVMWAGSPEATNRVLFLSPLALATLRCLVEHLPPEDIVPASALPSGRSLLCGEARDWDDA